MSEFVCCPSCRGYGKIRAPELVEPGLPKAGRPKIRDYLSEIADRHRITVRRLVGGQRTRQMVALRDVATILAHNDGFTLQQIGSALGGRDHTTIVTALRRIERKRYDPEFQVEVGAIRTAGECRRRKAAT